MIRLGRSGWSGPAQDRAIAISSSAKAPPFYARQGSRLAQVRIRWQSARQYSEGSALCEEGFAQADG